MSMRDICPNNYILCVYLQLSVCLTANHSVGVQSVHANSTNLILGTQSFKSACSCSFRLRCQVWLRLTMEIPINSESGQHTHHILTQALRSGLSLHISYVHAKWNEMSRM